MSRFKLLDCNNFWSPSGGGVRRYHLEKISYYSTRRDIDYVFVMHDSETYTEQIGENIWIEHLKVPKVLGNWEYRYLVKREPIRPIILKHNPDVIEVGSPYFMPRIINSIVKKYELKAKVFGLWHADFPVTYVGRFLVGMPFNFQEIGTNIAWRFARKHYNRMSGVLVSSQVIMERMAFNGICNLHFAPLGVNQLLFNPDKINHALRAELQAGNPNRMILFFPHRFSKEKGLDVLLEAYGIVCMQMDVAPALVLVGKGPYENLVIKAAEQLEHVHYKGFIDSKEEMATYYSSSDLGFALSEWETFGLSIVESMGAGLPLIAAGAGAAKEHIEKSGAGLIVKEMNAQCLAECILKFVGLKSKDELKQNAVAYAQKLNWENSFDRQLDIYQSIV